MIETWQPPDGHSTGLVIHIQDLHATESAQQTLAELIEDLKARYGVSLVALEGAEGLVETTIFSDFPDQQINAKLATLFLTHGLFTGAEYYAVTHPHQITLWGVEDERLYLDHLAAYQRTAPRLAQVEAALATLRSCLEAMKAKLYSKPLRTVEEQASRFDADKLSWAQYVAFLAEQARAAQLRLRDDYPNLHRMALLLKLEERLDQRMVEQETEALLKELRRHLRQSHLRQRLSQLPPSLDQPRSLLAYYETLSDLAQSVGIPLDRPSQSPYPHLSRYLSSLRLSTRLDQPALARELHQLEQTIQERLIKSDDERQLLRLSRALSVLDGLYHVRLSHEELDYFTIHRQDFTLPVFENAFHALVTTHAGSRLEALGSRQFEQAASILLGDLTSQAMFYRLAFQRDEAFVQRTLKALREHEQQAAILVAGGFHTQGLTKLFKQHNLAYVVISPKIDGDLDEGRYHTLLAGQLTPLETLWNDVRGMLLPPTYNIGEVEPPGLSEQAQPPPGGRPDQPRQSVRLRPVVVEFLLWLALTVGLMQINGMTLTEAWAQITQANQEVQKQVHLVTTSGQPAVTTNGTPFLEIAFAPDGQPRWMAKTEPVEMRTLAGGEPVAEVEQPAAKAEAALLIKEVLRTRPSRSMPIEQLSQETGLSFKAIRAALPDLHLAEVDSVVFPAVAGGAPSDEEEQRKKEAGAPDTVIAATAHFEVRRERAELESALQEAKARLAAAGTITPEHAEQFKRAAPSLVGPGTEIYPRIAETVLQLIEEEAGPLTGQVRQERRNQLLNHLFFKYVGLGKRGMWVGLKAKFEENQPLMDELNRSNIETAEAAWRAAEEYLKKALGSGPVRAVERLVEVAQAADLSTEQLDQVLKKAYGDAKVQFRRASMRIAPTARGDSEQGATTPSAPRGPQFTTSLEELKQLQQVDPKHFDDAVLTRLTRTLLVSDADRRTLAAELLRPLATSEVDLPKLRAIAKQLDDPHQFSWHSYALENLRLDPTILTEERTITPSQFDTFDDRTGSFQLFAVRVSDRAPTRNEDGDLVFDESSSDLVPWAIRITSHFSLNGFVSGYPWENMPYVTVVPFKDLLEYNHDALVCAMAGDVVFYRPVVLPRSTKVFHTKRMLITRRVRTAREQARAYLEKRTKVFQIRGTTIWEAPPNVEDRMKDWLIARHVPYGGHGSHWSLRLELLLNHFNELYDLLRDRRDHIREWSVQGGQLDDLEALDATFPWWHVSQFTDPIRPTQHVDGRWYDRYLRIVVRQFVQDPLQSKPQLLERTLATLQSFVPPRDLLWFDVLREAMLARWKQQEELEELTKVEHFVSPHHIRLALARLGLTFDPRQPPTQEQIVLAYEQRVNDTTDPHARERLLKDRRLLEFLLVEESEDAATMRGLLAPSPLRRLGLMPAYQEGGPFDRASVEEFWNAGMAWADGPDRLRGALWFEPTEGELRELEHRIDEVTRQEPMLQGRVSALLDMLREPRGFREVFSRLAHDLHYLLDVPQTDPLFQGFWEANKDRQSTLLIAIAKGLMPFTYPLTDQELRLVYRLFEIPHGLMPPPSQPGGSSPGEPEAGAASEGERRGQGEESSSRCVTGDTRLAILRTVRGQG